MHDRVVPVRLQISEAVPVPVRGAPPGAAFPFAYSMLEELEANTPELRPDAKYWFVRTNGGELYDAFTASNSIAISHRLVSISFVETLDLSEASRDIVKNEFKKYYPPTQGEDGLISDRSGLAASQLLRFCVEMKKGDVVLIPSESTERLGIGFIADDKAYEEELVYGKEVYPEFTKRRKVRWVRGVEKSAVNPNVFGLFLNHQAISDATPYAVWIDTLLYEFFSKGGTFHYVLKVQTREKIRAQALFGACLDLLSLADRFAKTEGIELGIENVETRINLNSPGAIELWQMGIGAAGLLSVLVVFINGGGFDFKHEKLGVNLSLKTEGLFTNLTKFLDARENRKTVEEVRKKLGDLKVETPEQVIALLNAKKE